MGNIAQWKDKRDAVWEWVKKHYLLCMIIADVILIALFVLNYASQVSDLTRLEFTEEQLRQYTADNSIGGSIDESRGSGLYDIIPDMFLEKGYYTYTVQYEGDSAESLCWPHTYVEFHDAIEQQTVSLTGQNTEGTRKFWLNVDLNIALRLYYSGTGTVSFKGFCIEETNVLANIELFSQLILLAGVNLVLLFAMRQKKKPLANSTKYSIVALVVVALIAGFPSLTGYIVEGHDLRFHIARIEGIREGLLSGQFPVRIAPTFYNGYGYANPIFYGELFLYFPALLRVIGFSVVESFNAYLIAMNIATVVICYYCGKKIFSNDTIAVTITFLYTLAPYRLMDIYTRAAIGEVTAMTFLPLVAYGLYRILTEDTSAKSYKRAYIPLTLGLTGIMQSHTLTGEMTGGVILLACALFCFKTLQKKRFFALVKTVFMTVLLNAWFLVPFVDFMLTQDIRVFATASTDFIQASGLFFSQLFSVFSDYSQLALSSSSGVESEMPLGMGLSLGLGMLLFITMLWVKNDEQKQEKKQGICFLILAVIVTYMTTFYFPWDRISTTLPIAATLVSSIQFVWRFMGIAAILAAIVTGYGLLLLYKKEGQNAFTAGVVVLIMLAVISAMDYSQDTLFNKGPVSISENTFTEDNNSYMAMAGEYALCDIRYEIVTEIFEPRSYEGVQITDYEKEGTNIVFTITNNNTEGYVLLPLQNYKGYEVSSEDGVITKEHLQMGENAVMRINIPANYSDTISVRYVGFWYWRIAELVSLLTAAFLLFPHIKLPRPKKSHQ